MQQGAYKSIPACCGTVGSSQLQPTHVDASRRSVQVNPLTLSGFITYHQQLCALQSCAAHVQVELHHAAARGLRMPHLICAILLLYSGYESGETLHTMVYFCLYN